MNEPIKIEQIETLTALTRSEIDSQVATAKAYPRDIDSCLNNALKIATIDPSTADDCFYALQRGGTLIEGVSVRFAEIIATCWGNMRVATRIIANDGKTITAQGICHDLESNVAVSVEVKRRITDKYGNTYSEDMQVTTGNAASAIAFRNAVLKVVPKAVTNKIVEQVYAMSKGKIAQGKTPKERKTSLTETIEKMLKAFGAYGVTEVEILRYLKVQTKAAITEDMIMLLRGTMTAIKEGTTTIEETFGVAPVADRLAEEAKAKSKAVADKVAKAMGV